MSAKTDLTAQEQAHVRAALKFLRARCDGWEPVSKLLRIRRDSLVAVSSGETVSASMAVRVARLAKVGIDDLLAGKFPPAGTCPYCGHVKEPGEVENTP